MNLQVSIWHFVQQKQTNKQNKRLSLDQPSVLHFSSHLQFYKSLPQSFHASFVTFIQGQVEANEARLQWQSSKHFLFQGGSQPHRGFLRFGLFLLIYMFGSRWRLSGRSWWSWAMAPVGRPASSLCSAKTSSPRCTSPPCLRTTWPTSRWTANRWAELLVWMIFFFFWTVFIYLQSVQDRDSIRTVDR